MAQLQEPDQQTQQAGRDGYTMQHALSMHIVIRGISSPVCFFGTSVHTIIRPLKDGK